jgi:prefoldin subunit 5
VRRRNQMRGTPMPKLDQQIETLQEKLKQLKTRQQAIDNRKRAISAKRERKADTRRKILVGAIVLAKVEQKVMDEKLLRIWLDEALTRGDDRALFSLSAKD